MAALQLKYRKLKAKWTSITCDARGGGELKGTADEGWYTILNPVLSKAWTRLPQGLLICHSCAMLKKKEMPKALYQVCQMTTLKKKKKTKESVKLKGKES